MNYHLLNPDKKLWQRIVDDSQEGTFFHTTKWSEIITEAFPLWKDKTLVVEFIDGNYAVFPLVGRRLFNQDSLYWYESMGLGTYGGPIFLIPPSTRQLSEIDNILKNFHNIQIVCNPFSNWTSSNNYALLQSSTHVLTLGAEFSEIQKGFAKSRREAIRYATRQNIEIKQSRLSDYVEDYFSIYLDQIKRWGKNAGSQYSLQLFKTIAKYSDGDSSIKFWTAWKDDNLISGVITFFYKKHAVLWHNATLTESMKYRPVDLLYSSVIEAAVDEGISYFDFGKSGGNKGLIRYKEHFGAISKTITIYKQRNLIGNVYRGFRLLRNYYGLDSEG